MSAIEADHSEASTTPNGAGLPVVRSVAGGFLMGLANLVPGVSGGTMIVVTGLYDEFITSIADVTRLRFSRRNIAFLAIVGGAAFVAIAGFAGILSRAVVLHPAPMFSLFIGMTLGGVPLLWGMLAKVNERAVIGLVVGLVAMTFVGLYQKEPPDKEAMRAAVARGEVVLEPDYGRDFAAGVLGMSAMVLPGISGAYMLLILGRYETILAAVSAAKSYAMSMGQEGDPMVFLRVIIPTAIGALLSIIFLSNALKWMLQRHRDATLGLLLGILLGSVVGIWPFDAASGLGDYGLGAGLAVAGFVATALLSRLSK